MKISIKDLDKNIQDKLGLFDDIPNQTKNGEFLMYRNGKFVLDEIEETISVSTRDIQNLSKYINKSEGTTFSSFDTKFTTETYNSSKFKKLYSSVKPTGAVSCKSNIINVFDDIHYLILTTNGELYDINKSTYTSTLIDLLPLLKRNFSLDKINAREILYVKKYGTGYLISLSGYGVYYINTKENIFELKFVEKRIMFIDILDNGNILLVKNTDEKAVLVYDFKTGFIIEASNHISTVSPQLPYKYTKVGKYFFILSKNINNNVNSSVLHAWELDKAKISYDNIDHFLHPLEAHSTYELISMGSYLDKLYITGIKENKTPFFLLYDVNKLSDKPTEISLDIETTYRSIKVFGFNTDGYIVIDDRCYTFDINGNIAGNFVMIDTFDISNYILASECILGTDNKSLVFYTRPKITNVDKMDFTVHNTKNPSNDITILFVSNNAKENVILYNKDTNVKVSPNVHLKIDDKYTLLKIIDTKVERLCMRLTIPDGTEIEGFVIDKSFVYIK